MREVNVAQQGSRSFDNTKRGSFDKFIVNRLDFFFLRDFIFKKTLFEKLQYLKQEQ